MAKRKQLADMTRTELGMAMSKAHKQFRKLEQEMHRRRLIEEYGAENPELVAYTVDISALVPLTIMARDEADAERIANEVWITDDRYEQITYDDSVEITIEQIETNEELTERALA